MLICDPSTAKWIHFGSNAHFNKSFEIDQKVINTFSKEKSQEPRYSMNV